MISLPPSVRRSLIAPHRIVNVSAVGGGLSGALVFRCQGEHAFALRRWPRTPLDRIREVHRVIAAAHGCELFPNWMKTPDGDDLVQDSDGFVWDLSQWMNGNPLQTSAALDEIQAGGTAICEAHRHLRVTGTQVGPSPGITARLNRIDQLERLIPMAISQEHSVPPELSQVLSDAKQVLVGWNAAASEIRGRLTKYRSSVFRLQYVLRDIHRQHILFQDGTPSAILDFDAIQVDTPLLDLSRWIADFDLFREDPRAVIDASLAGYHQECVFPTRSGGGDERKLLRLLAAATTWIGLANWVIWIALESRQFPDWQHVRMRMTRLVALAPRMLDWTEGLSEP